jgi:hypothetical protein
VTIVTTASQSKSNNVWIENTVCTGCTWSPLTYCTTLSALAALGAHPPTVLHCLYWLHLEPTPLLYYTTTLSALAALGAHPPILQPQLCSQVHVTHRVPVPPLLQYHCARLHERQIRLRCSMLGDEQSGPVVDGIQVEKVARTSKSEQVKQSNNVWI